MLGHAIDQASAAAATRAGERELADFLAFLASCGAAPVVFAYRGREAAQGLHVTEVKSGRFASIDCGAMPEAWSETFIQIWEADGELGPLTASTFVKIMAKAARDSDLDPQSRLTFEANSDGVIGVYALERAVLDNGRAHISLKPRRASCKPRDRWLAADREKASASCCAPKTSSSCCA